MPCQKMHFSSDQNTRDSSVQRKQHKQNQKRNYPRLTFPKQLASSS